MSTLMTDEELARVLQDTRVVVYVSEPFGFEYPASAAGETPGLAATILEVREASSPERQTALLELQTPFASEEGPLITHLLAGLRHEGERSLVEQLAKGRHVSANLSYSDQVPDDRRIPGVTPTLIGGIDLAR